MQLSGIRLDTSMISGLIPDNWVTNRIAEFRIVKNWPDIRYIPNLNPMFVSVDRQLKPSIIRKRLFYSGLSGFSVLFWLNRIPELDSIGKIHLLLRKISPLLDSIRVKRFPKNDTLWMHDFFVVSWNKILFHDKLKKHLFYSSS